MLPTFITTKSRMSALGGPRLIKTIGFRWRLGKWMREIIKVKTSAVGGKPAIANLLKTKGKKKTVHGTLQDEKQALEISTVQQAAGTLTLINESCRLESHLAPLLCYFFHPVFSQHQSPKLTVRHLMFIAPLEFCVVLRPRRGPSIITLRR